MMRQFLLRFRNKTVIACIAICIIAIGLRMYKLNQIPYGFYWDEAAISYNAWGLSLWNRDEFGNKLPVSFKSFGDYKAPLLIYTLGALYKVTGLHPEYLRILTSIFGIGIVFLLPLFAKRSKLVVALFIAVTPWAVNFSRIGVEVTFALFLFLLGVYFLEKSKKNTNLFLLSSALFILSMYAYHSAKLVTPLFLLLWSFKNWRLIFKHKVVIMLSIILGTALLLPMIKDTVYGSGFERGKSLIFYGNNLSLLPNNIASFANLDFWIFGKDSIGLRHGVPGNGTLYKTIFILMILGIIAVFKHQANRHLILWLLIGLVPSILSTDAPHAIRAAFALPPALLLADEGFFILSKYLKRLSLVTIAVETIFYVSLYYGPYAVNSATSFQYGYKEAILLAEKLVNENDKIIVTDYYGQPYIYTLLYRKITPKEFKFGALANYEFHKISWPDNRLNRIYVATPQEIPIKDPSVVKTINLPGTNTPIFVIAKKN